MRWKWWSWCCYYGWYYYYSCCYYYYCRPYSGVAVSQALLAAVVPYW